MVGCGTYKGAEEEQGIGRDHAVRSQVGRIDF
jgi:hypothetical protein